MTLRELWELAYDVDNGRSWDAATDTVLFRNNRGGSVRVSSEFLLKISNVAVGSIFRTGLHNIQRTDFGWWLL